MSFGVTVIICVLVIMGVLLIWDFKTMGKEGKPVGMVLADKTVKPSPNEVKELLVLICGLETCLKLYRRDYTQLDSDANQAIGFYGTKYNLDIAEISAMGKQRAVT